MTGREEQDPREIPTDVHLHSHRRWHQHDRVHQRTQRLGRFKPLSFGLAVQGGMQFLNAISITTRHFGM
ncbi:MAG: hypothetical protein JWR80_8251 [Bradyrhizobium sp.]|nr:hypothetical protein [Bradyrhizobium sp.]